MPYTPQAPPLIQTEGGMAEVYVGSPISGKPVTAVTEILNMPLNRFATEEIGRAHV